MARMYQEQGVEAVICTPHLNFSRLAGPGAIQQAIALARRPVSEVMVSPVATVSADTDLRRVAQVFLDTGLPALPVTDEDGRCSGFISRTDILRAMVADPPLDLWS